MPEPITTEQEWRDRIAAAVYADAEGVDPDERRAVLDAVMAVVEPLVERAEDADRRIQAVRDRHRPCSHEDEPICVGDLDPWPCGTVRALDNEDERTQG